MNKKHKNDTITSKKGTFRAFFNLVKIKQKKILEKKIIGEFWEKILKICETMVKKIHLLIKIFEKIAKEIHLFSKNQKIVQKRGKKKVEFTEISKIVKKKVIVIKRV